MDDGICQTIADAYDEAKGASTNYGLTSMKIKWNIRIYSKLHALPCHGWNANSIEIWCVRDSVSFCHSCRDKKQQQSVKLPRRELYLWECARIAACYRSVSFSAYACLWRYNLIEHHSWQRDVFHIQIACLKRSNLSHKNASKSHIIFSFHISKNWNRARTMIVRLSYLAPYWCRSKLINCLASIHYSLRIQLVYVADLACLS